MPYPKHIAIILDGNRRFAKRLMKEPWKGHEYGAKKISELLEWCKEFNIRELTLYCLSLQNFNRPKEEFDYLMKIFREGFDKLKDDERIMKYGIKIRVLGRIHLLPEDIQQKIKYIVEKTKDNKNYTINFALAYGGREEITDAVKKIALSINQGKLSPEAVNEQTITENLYMQDEPDLIIRTGGEKRTSNFLIWQSWYSEWMFLDKMWPEFNKKDFIACLEEYNKRERRFGK